MLPGLFITLEGGEGAGKTTQLRTIVRFLQSRGIDVLETREPGGNAVAEAIRDILLTPDLPAMHAETELLLMFAARHEHLQRNIIPALQAGSWVVCDRFTDATYAYQGYGRGVDLLRIAILESWVQDNLRPDMTFLFDLDVESGMQRAQARNTATATDTDRFEQEKLTFFQSIRQGYLERAQQFPDRFHILDASQSPGQLSHELEQVLETVLDARQQQAPV